MSHNTAFSWLNILYHTLDTSSSLLSIPSSPQNIAPLLNHTPQLSTLVHTSKYTSSIYGDLFLRISPISCLMINLTLNSFKLLWSCSPQANILSFILFILFLHLGHHLSVWLNVPSASWVQICVETPQIVTPSCWKNSCPRVDTIIIKYQPTNWTWF